VPDPAVWSIEASGVDEVVETYGYLTDVLDGYNQREQRVKLRAVPVEALEFSVLCEDARRSGLAESLLYGLQDDVLVLPLWQYGSRLTGDVNPGASTLPIADALDVPYRAGGYAVVWRDPFTFELFSVNSTSGAGVLASDLAVGTWPAYSASVYPARLARVASRVSVRRESSTVLVGRPVFEMETAEPTVAVAETLPLYRGVPVLSTVEPDRGDGALDDVERRVFLLDSATGVHAASAAADAPQTVRAFSWLCFSRAEVKELRQFIDARRGRGGAFWVLSWERDFDLVADQGANSSTLTVLGRDFSSRVFPTGQGRRHLGIRAPGGSFYYRHVDGAVDNLNGTETLQLDAAVPDALPAAGTFLASLRYSRLDADELRIEWTTGQFATCVLPIRDLPAETPA